MGFIGSLTGSDQADAAKDAAQMQAEAADRAILEQQQGFADVQGMQKPYADMNQLGWNKYQDLALGQNIEQTPLWQNIQSQQEDAINRMAYGSGKGGGTQMKRLADATAQNQLMARNQMLGEYSTLGQASSPATNYLSQARMGLAGNVGELGLQQANAMAGGQIGAANARGQGVSNMLQGAFALAQPAAAFAGGAMGAQDGQRWQGGFQALGNV